MPGYAFDKDGVRRIRDAVRAYEATPRNELPGENRTDRAILVRPAIVTTAISAASGTNNSQAGIGNARLLQRSATGAYTDLPGQTTTTVVVKVWNGYAGTVAVNKRIFVVRNGDDWDLLTADC